MIPRKLALLTGAIGVVGGSSMVLAPITAAVAADLGGAPADITRAVAAFGLSTAGSALLLAPRADMIGPDKALKQAVVLLLVALVTSMLAPSLLVLAVAQAIGGIGAGMALPAIYSLAPQVGPPGEEKRSTGLVLTGWTLALVAGVAGSGFLAGAAGWRTVYAVLAACMAVLLVAMLRSDLSVPRVAVSRTSPLTALRVEGVPRGLLSAGLLMFGFYGAFGFLGAHVADHLGLGATGTGWVVLGYGVGFGLSVFADPWIDRLSMRVAGIWVFGLLALTYLGLGLLSGGLWQLALFAVVWGVIQHLGLNYVVSRLAALEPRQRGAIMGLNSAVTYLAVSVAIALYRPVYDAFGMMGCAAVSALALGLCLAEVLVPARGLRTYPDAG
ncbi:MFS transporter [Pseudooceanicola nanhaiensis]|uniref:MFS transporter n=1 Tax=Pseudooceanicola nanhaiensis TaxID=375761 RepID=UPI001CD29D51|nr:MFS transporter [Pseudooceanicola nanhaiensis]MCA0919766.1 MFS transporter [Pseudooceanicola nanhaiensis]